MSESHEQNKTKTKTDEKATIQTADRKPEPKPWDVLELQEYIETHCPEPQPR